MVVEYANRAYRDPGALIAKDAGDRNRGGSIRREAALKSPGIIDEEIWQVMFST